ncbi:MAG: peptidylprolyl isomerase [Nitrospinae bacterium]|nr:peptidylprolyl isomerase [Nitrospinota bacterium]MBF0635079.1 peptidylprolyl isomerase [Nitrospinota bacterium]
MALRISIAIVVLALVGGSLVISFGGFGSGSDVKGADKKPAESAPGEPKPEFALGKTVGHGDVHTPETSVKVDFNSIPEIIGEVNGVPVKRDLLVRTLKSVEKTHSMTGQVLTQEKLDQIKTAVVDNILNSEVLLHQAGVEKIAADPEKAKENYEQFRKQFPNEEAFKELLKAQDMTEEEVKKEFERSSVLRALLEKNIFSKITVSQEETRKYYDTNKAEFERKESVHASHILARITASADPKANEESKANAKKKIEEVEKKLKGGADFAKLATEMSEDPGSAPKGGDLGFFTKGQMVPVFEKTAFELEAGKISPIVESEFGFHILKVWEKKPAGMIPFEEASKTIEGKLKSQIANVKTKEYLADLKAKLKVKKLI